MRVPACLGACVRGWVEKDRTRRCSERHSARTQGLKTLGLHRPPDKSGQRGGGVLGGRGTLGGGHGGGGDGSGMAGGGEGAGTRVMPRVGLETERTETVPLNHAASIRAMGVIAILLAAARAPAPLPTKSILKVAITEPGTAESVRVCAPGN